MPEYTTVTIAGGGALTAQPWDGTTGGIVAMLASGAVTNDGTIDVSGMGFRPGVPSMNTGSFDCVNLDGLEADGYGRKGEGLAALPAPGGRGNVSNAGGGGNCHNAGGAGGSNAGLGGRGGGAWSANTDYGGLGGAPLTFSTLRNVVLGGGGGAGHVNQSTGTNGRGGGGGGVIWLRALSLGGTGALLANGEGAPTNPEQCDPGGGGGGGGTIVVRTNGTLACGSASVAGGKGGDHDGDCGAYTSSAMGVGGGGGGGLSMLQGSSITCSVAASGGGVGTASSNVSIYATAGGNGTSESPPSGGFALLTVAVTAPTNGSSTTQPKPIISGTCAPNGDPVDVYVDGQLAATVTCTNGAFSYTPASNLALGAHTVSATLRDPGNQTASQPSATTTFTIVECLTNGNCSGAKPICDASTKACRPCSSANANADCNGNGVCAEGSTDPQKGRCVQCTSNAQCKAPSSCNTTIDTCVGCLVNAQCDNPKPVCGTSQICTACTWDADCAGRPATPACMVESGSCVECTATNKSACRGTTPVCDAAKNKCVGCNGDGDCAAGKTCVNQQCVGTGNDGGPASQPDAGVDAGAPPSLIDGAVEGGGLGCSTGGGTLASAWPILGGLALALGGLRRRRKR